MARIENPLLPGDLGSPDVPTAARIFRENIIGGLVGIFITVGVVFFVVQFLLGGIAWIMSEGDETKVKAARDKLQSALFGLVIIFSIFAIIKLIGYVFGLTALEGLQIPLVPLI